MPTLTTPTFTMEEDTSQNKLQQFKQWWNSLPKKHKINLATLALLVFAIPVSVNAVLHQIRTHSKASTSPASSTAPQPSVFPAPSIWPAPSLLP